MLGGCCGVFVGFCGGWVRLRFGWSCLGGGFGIVGDGAGMYVCMGTVGEGGWLAIGRLGGGDAVRVVGILFFFDTAFGSSGR